MSQVIGIYDKNVEGYLNSLESGTSKHCIYKIIEKHQENNFRESFTKKQIAAKTRYSYRSVERAINEFVDKGFLIRAKRGEYWIRNQYENYEKYLKEVIKWNKVFMQTVETMYKDQILKLYEELEIVERAYQEMIDAETRRLYREGKLETWPSRIIKKEIPTDWPVIDDLEDE